VSGWIKTTIGDVVTFQRGFDITRKTQQEGLVPVVSSGGISSFHNESAAEGPGVVIGRKGTLGKVFFLETDYWPHDTTLWVKDFKGNWPKFVYYFMTQLDVSFLDAGSANPTLNRNHLHPLKAHWPHLADQKAITDVLGALDDKIAANTKLDSLATETLAAGFKLMVPLTDESISFKEVATVTKGVSYRSVDLVESTSALVTLKSFERTGGYAPRGLKDYAGPYKPAQVIAPGEIVVAQTDLTQAAEVVGRAMRVPPSSRHETLIASLDLAIIRPLEGIPVEYLLGLLLDGKFRDHCRSRTSGTTVLHLASDAIPSFLVPVVAKEAQVAYAHFARPLLEIRESLALENESLARTRDTLLPQLMSGKLRVRDAEKTVEAVI
jgi:type I restriction enzyme S subunit